MKKTKKNFQKLSAFFNFESNMNKDLQFKFNVYNPKIEGLIFTLFILVIPFIFVFVSKMVFDFSIISKLGSDQEKKDAKELQSTIALVIQIACAIIGMIWLFTRDNKMFLRSSVFGIFAFILLPFIAAVIIGGFIEIFIKGWKPIFDIFLPIFVSGIAEVIIAVLMLKKVVNLKERILSTLKNNKAQLFIIVSLASLVVFISSILIGIVAKNSSENQAWLENPLHNESKVVVISYALVLFLFTVVIAPFVEEITMRDAIFTGTGNKWLGFIVSTLFFALTHVYASGDLQNIWMYLIPSVVFSGVFAYTKGNVTYTWLAHALSNLISFIIIIAGVS